MEGPTPPALAGYEIIKPIGSGGMSTVYEATDLKLRRRVALKMLHPHLHKNKAALERFRREALAAAKIDHPNIVRIYDYLATDESNGIVMEYVPGMDMETVVKGKGRLPFQTAAAIMTAVAGGLKEAHAHGLMHRDIKPSNILLHKSGRVMLSDFGLARQSMDTHVTSQDAVAGTPGFMSPEQISGSELTFSSDIYAWAVTFYFLMAGKLPYRAQEFSLLVAAIQGGKTYLEKSLTKDIPPKFRDLLERCLVVNPASRIKDGDELLNRLERFSDIPPLDYQTLLNFSDSEFRHEAAEKMVSRTRLYRRTLPLFKRIAALLALAGAVGIIAWFIQRKEEVPLSEPVPSPVIDTPVIKEKPIEIPAAPIKPVRPANNPVVEKPMPQVPDSGKLFIACDSAWAYIMIDGKDYGTTPMKAPITLPRGRHLIRLYNETIEPVETEVEILSNTVVRRRFVLKLKPAYRER